MKNTKVAKILVLSFLFLTIHILFSVKCTAQNTEWSAHYGPFANKANLREVIIKRFKKQIDEIPHERLLSDDVADILHAENERAEAKAYVEQPNALFESKDFAKVSPRVAKELNEWLGEDTFSSSDFVPRHEDFPKGRNVDPNNLLGLTNKDKWMTIQEWIDNTYLRVVERVKDKLEARMQKYIEDYNANKNRQ